MSLTKCQKLDLAYRYMFGSLSVKELSKTLMEYGIVDIESIFKGLAKVTVKLGKTKGRGCGHISDKSGLPENLQLSYDCAHLHYRRYHGVANYLKHLIFSYNAVVVFIDLANLMGGIIDRDYNNELSRFPVVYKDHPVVYAVIRPKRESEGEITVKGSVVYFDVRCIVDGKECRKVNKDATEDDDMLLFLLYREIVKDHPDHTFVLSGDNYRWRKEMGISDKIKYLKLVKKPAGFSPYSLMVNKIVNRDIAYALDGNSDGRGLPSKDVKTKLCSNILQKGKCTNRKCSFAHKRSELKMLPKQKTSTCKNLPKCKYGAVKCLNIHPEDKYLALVNDV